MITLWGVLNNSNDVSSNVKTPGTSQNILIADISNNQHISYLFNILQTSIDPAAGFGTLLKKHLTFSLILLKLFHCWVFWIIRASGMLVSTSEKLYNITSMVVDDLGIPSAFISLIFTLYYVHGKGQVTCCSKLRFQKYQSSNHTWKHWTLPQMIYI